MARKKSATATLEKPTEQKIHTVECCLQAIHELKNGRPIPMYDHPWIEGSRQQQYQRVAQSEVYDPAIHNKDFLTPKLSVAKVGNLSLESVLVTKVRDFEVRDGKIPYIETEYRITIRGLAKSLKVTKDKIIKLIQQSVQKWILYERRYQRENVFKVAGEKISLGTVTPELAITIINKLAGNRCKKAREFQAALVLSQDSQDHPFFKGFFSYPPRKKYLKTAWESYYAARGIPA